MRAGDEVTYAKPRGGYTTARVAAVVGSGASGFKTLDLVCDDGKLLEAVPHENDRAGRGGCWILEVPAVTPTLAETPDPDSTAVDMEAVGYAEAAEADLEQDLEEDDD